MENKQTVICAECGKSEDYDMKPGYPRKYCVACSAAKKAEYDNKTSYPVEKVQSPENQNIEHMKAGASQRDLTSRDAIIVAQVILKEASAMTQVTLTEEMTSDDIGRALFMFVGELTGAYKLALSNMQSL